MKILTSALLTIVFIGAAVAPAPAGPHDKTGGGQTAATKQSAPADKHAQQQETQRAAPQPQRAAPQERVRVNAAPQERVRVNAAPQERMRVNAAPQERVRVNAAPQERVREERFAQPAIRVRTRGVERNVAPFAQVIRPARERFKIENENVDREAAVPVVSFQPAMLSGEVTEIDNDDVFLTMPSGQVVTIVEPGWHGRHRGWLKHIMTIPVVYENGVYYAQPLTAVYPAAVYPAGIYPDAIYQSALYPAAIYPNGSYPAYGYAPSGGNLTSELLTASLASYVVSYLMNGHAPSLSSVLSNATSSVLAPSVYSPSTAYVGPAAYNPVSGYSYPSTCVYYDAYGNANYDPACAQVATAGTYASPNVYAPAQVQGVVVASTGSTLMVLGANGVQPIVVNDAPALATGYVLNGQPAVGQVVDALGYYSGSTFVATALE